MATVLITAGATREHLDDVRFLSNASTGRMGYALARAAAQAGHRAVLVSGPTELPVPDGVERHDVESALEMEAAVEACLEAADVVFGAAAVADARPAHRAVGKPPKDGDTFTLELVPNPDIIAGVGRRAGRRAVIGFALEAPGPDGLDGVLARGRDKLRRKHLDAIAVNLPAALGADESQVFLVFPDGRHEALPHQSKDATAARLVELGIELWRQKQ